MKRNLALLFALFWLPFLASAQEHQWSALYFNNGKLRADSTLTISAEQFKAWRRAESNIVAFVFANLTYPAVAHRNGVEGRVLLAFDYRNKEITNVRIINTPWEGFRETAIQAFQKATPNILNEFKYWNRNFDFKMNGTYYLPIDFAMIDFREEMKKRNAVPVLKIGEPLIGVHGH